MLLLKLYFLKNKKNIILIYFKIKNILKNKHVTHPTTYKLI